MSRDGLVDKNLATGEETRASQRGQDFNLRQNTEPEAPRSFDPPARQPSIRQQLQNHQPNTPAQPADFRQDDTRPMDATAPSTYEQDTGQADMPMEAARPTARSYEARSHENPAGPQPRRKQAAYEPQNATEKADGTGPYETPSSPGATPHSAENPVNTHHNATANGPTVLHSPEQPSTGQKPGRLKYSEGQPQAPPSGKPRQSGTKYHQKFTPDAAKPDEAIPDSTPAPDRPSRLRYGEEQPQDPPGAKPRQRQHSTKYQQKFTPDAAKPDGAGKTPVSDGAPSPAKPSRLQFAADEQPPAPDKKLNKLQEKSDRTAAKLDKARDKLPQKRRVKKKRVYDEAKGKAKTKFTFEKEVVSQGAKPPLPKRAGKAAGRAAGRAVTNKIHQKISEVEKDNVGVEATHKMERTAEDAYRTQRVTRSALRFVKERPYRRVAKLEKKAAKANIKLSYRQALNDNPKLKSNLLSRMAQKRKIKREYAKAAREAAKQSAKAAKKTGTVVGNVAKTAVAVVKRHPVVFGVIGLILFVVFFFSTLFTSCSNMATSGIGAILASSYVAEDADIDNAELVYTEWETDLQIEIANAESTHPGYDEYRYNVDDIGHNPYELMGYLTAAFQDFTYSEAQAVLRQIFAEQYQLSFVEEIEIRTRTVTSTDPETGEESESEEEYEWYILNVNLTARSFTDVITSRLTSDEWEIYYLLMQTKGNRQYLISPFDFNWLPYVTSYYGYRVHPISGEKNYHKGVDIGVPTGTDILAGHDGIVTAAAYDAGGYGYYVVLDGEKGLQSKYAHCDTLLVSVGQEVKKGDVIAKSGNSGNSTGPHLHLEVLVNGQYLNPLYFAETNDAGSGGIPPGQPGGVAYPAYPGAAMTDANFAALMEEAMKHLGKPYVFGASGPNSFDCSGFVSYVLSHSIKPGFGRTTAQGIYNQCTPVSPENAQPGDLIFFQGTYSTSSTVTHIGIYIGNGQMIHAGKPVQYASINTTYWQNHFYAFGRISN